MNKIQLIAGAVAIAASASVMAQGQFTASNATGAKPKIFGVDGVTGITGAGYLVEILAKVGGANVVVVPAFNVTLTGANAGLFSKGVQSVAGVASGPVDLTVRAWDVSTGATFAAATTSGSVTFSHVLSDPSAVPPGVPTAIGSTMPSFSLKLSVVPEPSTYALAALGLGGLLLFRRK